MTNLALDKPKLNFANMPISDNARKLFRWALIWIILANIGFIMLWAVGAPPRVAEIMATGVVGLIVRSRAFWIQCAGFCAALIYSVISFVAALFNLGITSLLYSLKFFAEINPSSSMEYIAAGGILLVTLIAAFFALRRDTNFEGTTWVLLSAGLFVGLALADHYASYGMRGHYARSAPAGAFFESASGQTQFFARADGKRNLILIMVESLGVPQDNAEMERKLFALYNIPAIKNIYDVSRGTSLYYNSTTSGEIRELCGRWGDYYALIEQEDKGCQPATMAAKGYTTKAMHSFDGDFFARKQWYPNIGFEKLQFSKDLIERGALKCGGVFPGACDRDVPRMITQELKKSDDPQFIYWLTVNAHLPVPPGVNLNVDNCERVSAILAEQFPMICRQFSIFDSIDRAVIKEITASDFPDSDILIVGDHMPPYFDRHHRSQFDPERVPYIYLKRKSESEPDAPLGSTIAKAETVRPR